MFRDIGNHMTANDGTAKEYFSELGGIPRCEDCENYDEFPGAYTGECLYLTDLVLQEHRMRSEVRVRAAQDASECKGHTPNARVHDYRSKQKHEPTRDNFNNAPRMPGEFGE